jgi:ribose transport system permease protein
MAVILDRKAVATRIRTLAPTRSRVLRVGLQTLGIGTFYAIILVFFSFASPDFLTYSNGVNILTNVSVIGIVALGQAFAIISGGFDLSVSGRTVLCQKHLANGRD